jgi:hypothetical protein
VFVDMRPIIQRKMQRLSKFFSFNSFHLFVLYPPAKSWQIAPGISSQERCVTFTV